MRPVRVTLKIYGNEPTRFIPPKYLMPGIRLYREDGSYYFILNNKLETASYHSIAQDNGSFPGADGSHISIEIDQEPVKREVVYIISELPKLIFV